VQISGYAVLLRGLLWQGSRANITQEGNIGTNAVAARKSDAEDKTKGGMGK